MWCKYIFFHINSNKWMNVCSWFVASLTEPPRCRRCCAFVIIARPFEERCFRPRYRKKKCCAKRKHDGPESTYYLKRKKKLQAVEETHAHKPTRTYTNTSRVGVSVKKRKKLYIRDWKSSRRREPVCVCEWVRARVCEWNTC